MADAEEGEVPAGFLRLPLSRADAFTAAAGPWYGALEDGRLVGAFRVLDKHLNPNRVCHGGLLATFCDVMMSTACAYAGGDRSPVLPTVSLSLDYLRPTPAGAWVELRTELLRRTSRTVFARGLVTADGEATVSANAVLSVPRPDPDAPDLMAMFKQMLLSA